MKINSFIQYAPITKQAEAPAASANKTQLKPVNSLPEFEKQPGLPSRLQPKEEKTYTTMAVGEEGSSLPIPEDLKDKTYTTMAVGEEGSSFTVPESLKDLRGTTAAVGEEGGTTVFDGEKIAGERKYTTMAIGEEGGMSISDALENVKDKRGTTMAIGEEGGMSIGEAIKGR